MHFVTYNRHIHRNVGEAESKDSVCSQVLLSLNTEKQFLNDHETNICALPVNVIWQRVHPALYGARGGPVPEAPVHHGYCLDSSGIMRELWPGCWEEKWQHSSPDPFLILGNPSWADSRLTHSFRVEERHRPTTAAQAQRGPGDSNESVPINRLNNGLLTTQRLLSFSWLSRLLQDHLYLH